MAQLTANMAQAAWAQVKKIGRFAREQFIEQV
jgi:hypothetical protein